MFDVYIGDVNLTLVILIASILLILPCQLLLCFKVKRLFTRLIPSVLFAAGIVIFTVLAYSVMDWSALFYIICAVYSGLLLFMCAVGWAVYGIWRSIKKQHRKHKISNN